MPCPWYITARAVRDYAALRGYGDPDDDAVFYRALDALIELVDSVLASGREPKRMESGALRYRGPKPDKLMLYVRDEPRPEGPLPQLVRVIAPGRMPQ